MKGMTPRNDDEKEFMKTFDSLCYGHSRYQVWDDFVHMFAISIVNAVDKVHFEEREQRYMRIVKQYDKADMEKFVHLAQVTTLALEKNPAQDFLGELYMRCDLGNEANGQFFTPYHICDLMAKVTTDGDCPAEKEIEEKGWISLCDCCIGGGAMMIAAVNSLREKNINYQTSAIVVGQDIDPTVAMMAYIQLSLLGCAGYIKVGNSLTDPLVGHPLFGENGENVYYMPMFFTEIWHMRRVCEQMKRLFLSTEPKARDAAKMDNPKKYFFFFDQEAKQWTKEPSETLTSSSQSCAPLT